MDKFVTFGTSYICPELFKKTLPYPNNYSTKPYGGLWLSFYDELNSNEWLNYLSDKNTLFYKKFNGMGSIITLKDNARILYINNENDFNKIYNIFPNKLSSFKLLDYQKLSKIYDGIFISAYAANSINYNDWCISSLNLFNINSIENFTPINLGYVNLLYDKEYYLTNEEEKKKIRQIDYRFLSIYEKLKNDFWNTISLDFSEDVDIYYNELFHKVYDFVKNNIFNYSLVLDQILENEDLKKSNKSKEDLIYTIMHNILYESYEKFKPKNLKYPDRLIRTRKNYI